MSHSYSSAATSVPRTGQYWNPAGDYEFHDTVYTLAVYVPPRPPSKYLPAFLCREPLDVSPFHVIRPIETKPDYTHFHLGHLPNMEVKTIKIKAHRFPVELRCKHVAVEKVCNEGCYVLEKGGEEVRRFRCMREDCQGHVYSGKVKEDEAGVKCFGKKGTRMVCSEGMLG